MHFRRMSPGLRKFSFLEQDVIDRTSHLSRARVRADVAYSRPEVLRIGHVEASIHKADAIGGAYYRLALEVQNRAAHHRDILELTTVPGPRGMHVHVDGDERNL